MRRGGMGGESVGVTFLEKREDEHGEVEMVVMELGSFNLMEQGKVSTYLT